MKITVIGTGYVGLVTGACLAEMGNQVVCLDLDAQRIAALNRGEMPIHEPGLGDVVARNAQAGRLRFTTDIDTAVAHGLLQFIAVGTPPSEDGSADLQHVLAAARAVAERMQGYKLIINKSTVPVGTADAVAKEVAQVLAMRGLPPDFAVVSNPEFLKEGSAVQDFMRPDRVIVGSDNEHATALMRTLYAPFMRRLPFGTVRTARAARTRWLDWHNLLGVVTVAWVLVVGVTGVGMATLFATQGAPDLALTQVLVEIVTLVTFVLVLRRLPSRLGERNGSRHRIKRALAGIGVGVTMAVVAFIATGSRIATPASEDWPWLAAEIGHGKNIVNVALVDIRGWDTMGELSVMIAAATGVASLIFVRSRADQLPRLPGIPARPSLRAAAQHVHSPRCRATRRP